MGQNRPTVVNLLVHPLTNIHFLRRPLSDEDDSSSPGCSLLGGVCGPSYHRSLALRCLFSFRSSSSSSTCSRSCWFSSSSAARRSSISSLVGSDRGITRRDGMVSDPE